MPTVPNKVRERIQSGLKLLQPVLQSLRTRDVGEADTVTIVKDLLASVFGYDKYADVTSEHAIRGTFVDLALKVDGQLMMLIEVKAIGLELKDNHVKQAVDYAANQGVEWVTLTNGCVWQVYRVSFKQPIEHEMILRMDLLALSGKNEVDVENCYVLSREGMVKSTLGEFHSQKQALSRYVIGAMLLTDPVLDVVRRELRRMSPDSRIDTEQIAQVLEAEVIKREVLEGERADEARKKINRAAAKAQRAKAVKSNGGADVEAELQPSAVVESREQVEGALA
jgi:hypothetical protein